MPKNMPFSQLFVLSLAFASPLSAAEKDLSFDEYLGKANDYIKVYRHFEAGDALKKATKLKGAKHPSLHLRLGTLYYDLGLIPEAIAEIEKAVAMAPFSKWHNFELAKFYFVDKQYSKAEDQFITLLKIDPGFTLGYRYLAEIYFRNKDYDKSWLSLQRAGMLGHQGKLLEEKLAPHTSKPTEDFAKFPENTMLFRFIKFSSEEEATTTLKEIGKGKLFENLELELKNEKAGEAIFRMITFNELQDSVAEFFGSKKPYSSPVVIKSGEEYLIMQKIAPFNPVAWQATVEISSATAKDTPEIQRSHSETGKEELASHLAAYYVLEIWKNAWQAADVSRYLAAYSSKFTPPGNMDLASWKKKREASLTRPNFIHVTIKDPIVELLTDNQMLVTFRQNFESDTYQDTVIKTLTLIKEAGGWKISDERTVQELSR